MIRLLVLIALSALPMLANAATVWTDQPGVYKMQKSNATKPATRYRLLPADEVKALVPAPTRAEIEAKAVTFGMTYPVPITKEFVEAEAGKLGMVYPSTPAATEPDVTLLQRVYVNANAPCVALKADLVKSLGGKYYQANISLWDATKPIALGLGCN